MKHHLAHPSYLPHCPIPMVLRWTLVRKSTPVRDMVRGDGIAPGFNMFSATFFVKEGPAVGAGAPLLEVSKKKYSGLAWGPLFHPHQRCRLITSPDGRWGGINSFMSLVPGLRPSPKECSSDKGEGLTPQSWWGNQTLLKRSGAMGSPLGEQIAMVRSTEHVR